jgi:hypothetical protein
MSIAMMAAPMEVISTPPAATSLARSTAGCRAGDATSHKASKAVLSASAVHTAMIAATTTHHSRCENPTTKPVINTAVVATA